MKKILLATTVLAMSATVAAAEITLGGSATMGVARDGAGDFETYSTAKLSVTMSGETDGGLSFGASMSATAGQSYTFADDDGFAAEGGAFGQPEVFLSGAFGKISMKQNGYNFFVNDDDDDDADVKYEITSGGLTFGLVAKEGDWDYSAKVGYSQDALSVAAAYDTVNGGAMGSIGYTMGAITATVVVKNDVAGDNSVTIAYAADGLKASIKLEDDSDWKVTAGYSANGVSFGVETNQSDKWKITAGYDLGGGASVEAGVNYTDDAYAGVAFKF
jgi:outer membrane protein OmpU